MLLKGPRVTLRPLTRSDLDEIAAWRPFDNPLYVDANWAQRSSHELDRWFARHSKDPQRLLCAITDETERVIGSITLREIDGRCSARLGITLGADFVNQGYGTEALTLFLDYYFKELGFKKIVLDVAAYNRRAIRVYERMGFETVGRREQPANRRQVMALLREPCYDNVDQLLRRDWFGRRWLLCYDMELVRENWEKRHRFGDSRLEESN